MIEETLEKGYKFDRNGLESGTFVSPEGASLSSRSLPNIPEGPPNIYEVLEPISGVKSGPAIPWYGQQGKGIQHQLPSSIENLLNESPPNIKRIN